MNADELNRRETALSFLKRATELLSEGNVEKATSLVEKARSRCPDLVELASVERLISHGNSREQVYSSSASPSAPPPPSSKSSTSSSSPHSPSSSSEHSSSDRKYSNDDAQSVQDVLSTRDFYALLHVEKHATDKELTKAYRKIAVRVHPDKNLHPKANEAFKRVSEAYAVLSDVQKRKIYDQFGEEGIRGPSGGGSHYGPGGAHVFTDYFDADELFFNIFGGGMHPGFRRRSRGSRSRAAAGADHGHFGREENVDPFILLRQLAPFLVVFIGYIVFAWMQSSPTNTNEYNYFSLTSTRQHPVRMFTMGASRLEYYTSQDIKFRLMSQRHIRQQLEVSVRSATASYLDKKCKEEQSEKSRIEKELRSTFTGLDLAERLDELTAMEMEGCSRLDKLTHSDPEFRAVLSELRSRRRFSFF